MRTAASWRLRAGLVPTSIVLATLAACGGGDNPPPYDIPTQQRLSDGTTVHAQASADIQTVFSPVQTNCLYVVDLDLKVLLGDGSPAADVRLSMAHAWREGHELPVFWRLFAVDGEPGHWTGQACLTAADRGAGPLVYAFVIDVASAGAAASSPSTSVPLRAPDTPVSDLDPS